MQKNKKAIIISGATCTGKTDASIMIAKELNNHKFEIINFDSLLFYKEVNIGTAKPSSAELKAVKHHLININSIANEVNANIFIEQATEKLYEIAENEVTPILVGGSTFYLRALMKGMYESETITDEVKSFFKEIYDSKGISEIIEYLKVNDPESLKNLHKNDHYRLIRAAEHFKQTGQKISKQKEMFDAENPYDFSKHIHTNFDFLHLSMTIEKEQHWKLMEKRASKMIQSGLIEEVKTLLEQGYSGNEKPLQSIGYKETIQYLNGDISDEDELAEKIYINTRRLAKSQKTFLKKVTPKTEFSFLTQQDNILESVDQFLNNN
ncbi:MAG: tRNA (adenosine(37)-N6)-dimethylallyltransferase MiaA [Bdellovibrionota bacterium]|nr:tRNA (adenosine(37)-N6)-dimethylallyltransferase MiaA [Bdellovibrionota bacterium]